MWKKNVLVLAGMAFLLAVGTLGALCYGGYHSWPLELLLPLAVTFGASGASLVGLAAQIAQPDPPNHHKIAVDHEYRMAQLPDHHHDA